MDIQIVTIFYLCDKPLEALNSKISPQMQMIDAKVMTTGVVAALFFGGNFQVTCDFPQAHGYIPNMLSKSRFNRRLHRIKAMFIILFKILKVKKDRPEGIRTLNIRFWRPTL